MSEQDRRRPPGAPGGSTWPSRSRRPRGRRLRRRYRRRPRRGARPLDECPNCAAQCSAVALSSRSRVATSKPRRSSTSTQARWPSAAAICSSGRSQSLPVIVILRRVLRKQQHRARSRGLLGGGDDLPVDAQRIDRALSARQLGSRSRSRARAAPDAASPLGRARAARQADPWRSSSASRCGGAEAPWAWHTFFLCARRPRLSGKKEGGGSASMLRGGFNPSRGP